MTVDEIGKNRRGQQIQPEYPLRRVKKYQKDISGVVQISGPEVGEKLLDCSCIVTALAVL